MASNKVLFTGQIYSKYLKNLVLQNYFSKTSLLAKSSYYEELRETFNYRNTNISSWIIENKVRVLSNEYTKSTIKDRKKFLLTLSSKFGVQHKNVIETAKKMVDTEINNERRMISCEKILKNSLIPPYQWLFIMIGRLEHGVKFLVDIRKDVLDLASEIKDTDAKLEQRILLEQLNETLRDLLLLWFSVGFLHLQRITWESSCDILQKVSEYEAIHPMKNWMDLKKRVGPYRRCYIFSHPSMPREPLVVLHTALCDTIPESVRGIKEAEVRILGKDKKEVSFIEEDKCKIKAAIFYSIASTQKGLKGIELGNYLIKEVVKKVSAEFPLINLFSTLSPIPEFRIWFFEKIKQDPTKIFTSNEYKAIQDKFKSDDVILEIKKIFNTSLWTNDVDIKEIFKIPLIRSCAWYLYKEKRRNYALNQVANFHLRNGAVMWRINWLADPTPRGAANSFGLMVNYRYYLEDCEINSRSYIENYIINASANVQELAEEAGRLMACK
ncbi:malonyl-CoA decarboxylase, mitochondrial-like [Prorops nasuta]|uniref:malonyl-CoA decarboxylase, mitochondrial-like n=1 Tax=Prorops nasuta TaxID=863751 RepID=UPI0034CD7026